MERSLPVRTTVLRIGGKKIVNEEMDFQFHLTDIAWGRQDGIDSWDDFVKWLKLEYVGWWNDEKTKAGLVKREIIGQLFNPYEAMEVVWIKGEFNGDVGLRILKGEIGVCEGVDLKAIMVGVKPKS